MPDISMNEQPFEVHDPDILAQARGVLNACQSGKAMHLWRAQGMPVEVVHG